MRVSSFSKPTSEGHFDLVLAFLRVEARFIPHASAQECVFVLLGNVVDFLLLISVIGVAGKTAVSAWTRPLDPALNHVGLEKLQLHLIQNVGLDFARVGKTRKQSGMFRLCTPIEKVRHETFKVRLLV